MDDKNTLQRPAVMDELSDTQMKELEFQASEYDEEQFKEIAATYGWDEATVTAVWKWFEVQPKYPLDGTKPTE